jgi:hypothetical protein
MGQPSGNTVPSDGVRFRRVLLKVSGEALMGQRDYGLDPEVVNRVANEVKAVIELEKAEEVRKVDRAFMLSCLEEHRSEK